MKRWLLVPVILVGLLLLAVVGSIGLTYVQIQTDAGAFDDVESIDTLIEDKMNRYDVPGVAVVLVDEATIRHSSGYSIREDLNITPDSRFQLASVSKPLAAWAVMHLVQTGEIDLDAPVSEYITRWSPDESGFDADGITVRRLLSHTAGLSLSGYAGFEVDPVPQTLDESLAGADDADGEAVRVTVEPGTQWLYSGGGYSVLELLVEEVSGESFTDYIQREIFDPLGMENVTFTDTLPDDLVPVYDREGETQPPRTFAVLAARGMIAPVDDVANWLLATVAPAQYDAPLDTATLDAMFAPQPATTSSYPLSEVSFGLGYRLETTSGEVMVASHDGNNPPGWRTHITVIPAQNAALAVLTNHPGGESLHRETACAWITHQTGDVTYTCMYAGFWGVLPLVGGVALLFTGVMTLAFGFYGRVSQKRETQTAPGT